MQLLDDKLVFSATDLSSFLACPHLTLLTRRARMGGRQAPYFGEDPGLKVVQQRGIEHEKKFLAGLTSSGTRQVVDLKSHFGGTKSVAGYRAHAAATLAAMGTGADVIYQACLFDGDWLGYADFLLKVDRPGSELAWSYEVADTKLAHSAKAGALLQILLYSELLAKVQGVAPHSVHLALGGPEGAVETFRVNDFAAYFRSIKRRFLEWVAAAPDELPLAVDPVDHCSICDWNSSCRDERRAVDHLSFVAGITRQQRRTLALAGITTLEGLGSLNPDAFPRLDGVSPTALARIHHQARVQLEGRRRQKPLHELLQPVVTDQGLAALPSPSAGDLFFDFEGDPYAFEQGIEFLFGLADVDGNYTWTWALDRQAERKAFESFMDMVVERLKQYPDLHIYHYAAYEPTALKRLAGRFDSRVEELDQLLRGKVFVDLYRVVRQGLRASVESYSIKKMEEHYGYQRQVELREASAALGHFEAWLQLGGGEEEGKVLLDAIREYNKDDCLSTLALRTWLEQLRAELEKAGTAVPRPTPGEAEPSEELSDQAKLVEALVQQLTAGVPADVNARSSEQHGRWLMAQMLEYHRREKKTMWWRYFEWMGMSEDELVEDRSALGDLEFMEQVGTVVQSHVYRYRFPAQEHGFEVGKKPLDQTTKKSAGEIIAIDDLAHTIDLKRGKSNKAPHPSALIPNEDVPDRVMRDSLFRLGSEIAAKGFSRKISCPGAVDLLLGSAPNAGQEPAAALMKAGENPVDAAVRLGLKLDHSILPIQGPPGSGKTYTGARMILALLEKGKKVGITATSHKVISNLLHEVCEVAKEAGKTIHGMQRADEDDWCGAGEIVPGSNEEIREALESGTIKLAAGTAWLWSRPEMTGLVDVLFIDEAGQFSLANALAVAPAAGSLVLLGDPQQLDQPQQGLHPPGSEVSALDHLLHGQATIHPARGLFLDQTWRLHPTICEFTSEIYYDGRLRSRPGLEVQQINGTAIPTGSGLRWYRVEHLGNQNESVEEAETVREVVTNLLDSGVTWVNQKGEEKQLRLSDILIVAPYNAQVAAIRSVLPEGARVGTVDKFQGQEAPVVIYSMATSSAEDAPRGMPFLYSPNRLNVATSRARCLVILVANGQLLLPECRTPDQMRLANGLCRYRELSSDV